MNSAGSLLRRKNTHDSITALRHASVPAWVEASTRCRTFSGYRIASCCATAPPSECPTTCAEASPIASRNAARSSARLSRRSRPLLPDHSGPRRERRAAIVRNLVPKCLIVTLNDR